MRFITFIFLFCLGLSAPIVAFGIDSPDEMLKNPVQEQRAQHIGAQLRCLVCQNESIEDSSADLAKDLRKVVRQRIKGGDNDQQVMQWMVDRYGNFIRLSPPFTLTTALLWFMPVLGLVIGCVVAFVTLRKKNKIASTELSKEERQRLSELMKE
ncbi:MULTISPECIES: cytochrome c-type biogenesis protein [Commensalibacter]|uniref:Cytochrome c-type biogenesis protein n=2 Tax=Commensalibacter TaxID=1079922 RepID=W7DM85_9PROT|nr:MULTISPECIES: cytochrome c-type biogenesis protein [Commensalibacter]EUK18427.1 cytochrome c-type biogenesis protein [Commensalibacter papalotli (ex Servin-Garciduenas et al. 2014)]CAI3933894.1 Cytochrome c-type biogenesis protein CcmH/NrfF (NrfF) (PDB:2HL7) [Commensalibacter papalotli (ex Botero et al. 2024)]CAI3941794.1 Cytochrome c-type biogenesis protein CcmH/NrfF (NrfF) (PDB:2HL7) [Commensalibacter papalotli (ex Botero et al. 2024)]